MRKHRVLIAVPALDMMPVQTAYSMLSMKRDCPSRFSFIVRASCHDARNLLALEAVESDADRVLWIDSDMAFEEDLMLRLGADLDLGWDMVCGLYFKRELPTAPVIYSRVDAKVGQAEVYADYPKEQVFPVAGCGFGAVMMTTELLRRVDARNSLGPGKSFLPYTGLGEDLSFCARAGKVGARIACDSRIRVGHVGLITYGEPMYRRPRRQDGGGEAV